MTRKPWCLIPPDTRVEKIAVADLSPAELWAELDRIGNNWRDVTPRFTDIVQRVVKEFGGGAAAHQHLTVHDAARVPEIAALIEAAKRSAEGWANAIELNIIHARHVTSAGILRDELDAALRAIVEGRA